MRVEVGNCQTENSFWLLISISNPTEEKNDNPLWWKSQTTRKRLVDTLIEAVKQSYFDKYEIANPYLSTSILLLSQFKLPAFRSKKNSNFCRMKASLQAYSCWLEPWWKNWSPIPWRNLKLDIEVQQKQQHIWRFQTIKIPTQAKLMIFCLHSATQVGTFQQGPWWKSSNLHV